MNSTDIRAFSSLFEEVIKKCFGQRPAASLSEPECRLLSNEIEIKTGLVIGWKSLKNYATFVFGDAPEKRENPSVATLDTLARYVAGAPVTTEIQRKKLESHYPYWYNFRAGFATAAAIPEKQQSKKYWKWVLLSAFLALPAGWLFIRMCDKPVNIIEGFDTEQLDNLEKNGWTLQSKVESFWQRNDEHPGCLTLFTLHGDNWPNSRETPVIRNLMLHKIDASCFNTEIRFIDFIPRGNWQQAGILLLEDTTFAGKSLRMSLAYNDFFGGFSKPGEIIVQAMAAYGKGYSNPEEIVHYPVFGSAGDSSIIHNNLKYSALRIEKKGRQFRFLFAASQREDYSYKELLTYEFDIKPMYIGIFALKGFVDSTAVVPVCVDFFRLEEAPCYAN